MMLPNRSPILASRVGKPIPTALAAWYRYNTGITSSGGTVSAWANQTGGEALVQATSGNRPTLESDGTILFNGVDQFLKTAPFTLNQPTTVYFLGRQVTWTAGDKIFDGDTSVSGEVRQSISSPNIRARVAAGDGDLNSNLAVGSYGVICVVFSGANSLLQINSTSPVAQNLGTTGMGGFTLGRPGAASIEFGNIQAKEVLIYNAAHDANQRAAVIAYLNMVNQL
jgi:hypothetical protein